MCWFSWLIHVTLLLILLVEGKSIKIADVNSLINALIALLVRISYMLEITIFVRYCAF